MAQKTLKFSLAISFLGILLLLLISNLLTKEVKIQEINENWLNRNVKVLCKVTEEKNYQKFCILTCQDKTGKIKINFSKNLNLINKTLIIEGKIVRYKGELEIQAHEIKEK